MITIYRCLLWDNLIQDTQDGMLLKETVEAFINQKAADAQGLYDRLSELNAWTAPPEDQDACCVSRYDRIYEITLKDGRRAGLFVSNDDGQYHLQVFALSNEKSLSGKDFVLAICAYLNERQETCVCFERSSYEYEEDIPFCRGLNGRIDSVSVSFDRPGCIDICVVRDGKAVYGTFDGTEDEDFDYLFHEVYYYINEADAPEADDWIRVVKETTPLKEFLITKILQSIRRTGGTVAVPNPILYPLGPMERSEQRVIPLHVFSLDSPVGQRAVVVVESGRLPGCDIVDGLRKMGEGDLVGDYDFLLSQEIENYHRGEGVFEETDDDRAFLKYLLDEQRGLQLLSPKWEIVYEEECPDSNGVNNAGVIMNMSAPNQVLFFHAFADEEGGPVICHVYNSIYLFPESQVCEYPWTAENDEVLLAGLSSLYGSFCFRNTDGPLSRVSFKDTYDAPDNECVF